MIDTVTLLSQDQVEEVHAAALHILDSIGVKVESAKARRILCENGCCKDEETHIVKIPSEIAVKFIKKFPSTFTFYGREPEYDRKLPEDGPLFTASGTVTSVRDLENGEIRESTSADIAVSSYLTDALDGMDLCTVSLFPTDAPKDTYRISMLYSAAKNSRKPIVFGGDLHGKEMAEDIVQLGAAILGSEEAYRKRPFFIRQCCPIVSPLCMEKKSIEDLIYYSEQKLPFYFVILPIGGLMSPMSVTGTLVQGTAEFLASAILMQMVRPGAEVMFNILPVMTDMRTASYASGAVETGMMMMGAAQMARFYGVPSGGFGGHTNAHTPDAQAGYESAITPLGCVLAGMGLLNSAGMLGGISTFDNRMLVIDNDISLMIRRMAKEFGFSKDEVSSAVDAIAAAGPGGQFLKSNHTRTNAGAAFFYSEIATRMPFAKWENLGSKDIAERSFSRIKEILLNKNPSVLSREIHKRVADIFPGIVEGDAVVPESWKL